MTNVPWREALNMLAGQGDLCVRDRGLAGLELVARPQNQLAAFECPLQRWVHLLATFGQVDLVAAGDVGGTVSTRLSTRHWEDAIADAVADLDHVLEREGSLLRVSRGGGALAAEPVERHEQFPRLEATAITPEGACALLGGRIVVAGSLLLDPVDDSESTYRVEAIEPEVVRVVNTDPTGAIARVELTPQGPRFTEREAPGGKPTGGD